MDLATLLQSFGMPDTSETPGDTLPSLSLPSSAPMPMAMPGSMTPEPSSQLMPPSAPKHGKGDFIRDLAPMLISAIVGMKNPGHGAALAQGAFEGAHLAEQEGLAADQRNQQKQMLAGKFMQQTAMDVMQLKDPIERQKYLELADDIGSTQFGLPKGWTARVPAHDTKDDLFLSLKTELGAKLKAFDADKKAGKLNYRTADGRPISPDDEGRISFRLSNGQSMPVNRARQLLNQALFDADGRQLTAVVADDGEAPENKTDYSRFLTRWAKDHGKKSANELTATEELAAKKAYGQADDRPLKGTDPITQAINAMRLENLQKNSGAQVTPGQATAAGKLADDFRMDSKDFVQVSQAFNRVKASAQDPSAAGDLALIFNYMKTLDPGSTVREGEFATAQNAGGIPDRIAAAYNRVKSGERLSADQRADFVARSKRLYEQARQQHGRIAQQYRNRAKAIGVPEELVITDYTLPDDTPATTAATPSGAPKKIGRFSVQVGGGS